MGGQLENIMSPLLTVGSEDIIKQLDPFSAVMLLWPQVKHPAFKNSVPSIPPKVSTIENSA